VRKEIVVKKDRQGDFGKRSSSCQKAGSPPHELLSIKGWVSPKREGGKKEINLSGGVYQ